MRLVIIESPYAGDVAANVEYARRCVADSLARGEAPYASHLIYTQPGILDDTIADERDQGIAAGFAWAAVADVRAVYMDLGMSAGMVMGVEDARRLGQRVERRMID